MGFSEWFFILLMALNILYGTFRGGRMAIVRLSIMLVALGASLGAAVGLKALAGGFSLGTYLVLPEGAGVWLNGLLPFNLGNGISQMLHTLFFMNHLSMLVVLPIFLIFNKIGGIIYKILRGSHHIEEKVDIKYNKKKKAIPSLTSILLGLGVGLVQGFLICGLVYGPIAEIAIELVKLG